jgi:hypothetical protein
MRANSEGVFAIRIQRLSGGVVEMAMLRGLEPFEPVQVEIWEGTDCEEITIGDRDMAEHR